MMCSKKYILCLTVSIILSACGQQRVEIYIDDELSSCAENLLSAHPLPEEYIIEITHKNPESAAITITQKIRTFSTPQSNNPEKVIKRRWLVPVISLYQSSGPPKQKLLPLEDITLPARGLAVDGLYPGDEGYAYCEETLITIKDDCPEGLKRWFYDIKDDTTISPVLWIAAVGDIMPEKDIADMLVGESNGLNTVFLDTKPVLMCHDLLLGNLECAVTSHPERMKKNYNFRIEKSVLEVLIQAGFDYLSITNNHSFDYGLRGFLDTLKNLESLGIATSGVGKCLKDAKKPWQTVIGKQQIKILSLRAHPIEVNIFRGETQAVATTTRPGMLWADQEAYEAVRSFCSIASFDIVIVHGGDEFSSVPGLYCKKLFRKLIDLGADVVIASHPHVLQGLEVYKNKLIAYSLGNFLFPDMGFSLYCNQSLILSIGIYNNKILYVKPIPVQINKGTIMLDKSGRILQRFQRLTDHLNRHNQ
jgi:hypothetical protein